MARDVYTPGRFLQFCLACFDECAGRRPIWIGVPDAQELLGGQPDIDIVESDQVAKVTSDTLDSSPVFLLPPWGRSQERSSDLEFRDLCERTVTEVDSSTASNILGVLLPAASLVSRAGAWFRAAVMEHWTVLAIAYGHLQGARVHHRFTASFLLLRPGTAASSPVRMLDVRNIESSVGVESEVASLFKRRQGRSRIGYILGSQLPAIESWSFENHNPELDERAVDLESFGITRQLGELFDVLISGSTSTSPGVDPSNDIRIISARDLRPNGNIELSRASAPQRAAARSVRLARGDILIRSIAIASEQLCACVVSDDDLPAEAGASIMVLRAKSEVPAISLAFVASYLQSQTAGALLTRRAGGEMLHILASDVRQLPIPIPDDDVVEAIVEVHQSISALETWANEARDIVDSVFDAQSFVDARARLLRGSRRVRSRVQAANLLDDLGHRVRTTYPYPVAYRWRTAEAHLGDEDVDKTLGVLLDCFETLMCYLAQLALVHARVAEIPVKVLEDLRGPLTSGRQGTTIGTWTRILQEVCTRREFRVQPAQAPLTEIRDVMPAGGLADQARQRLARLRNRDSHGTRRLRTEQQEVLETAQSDIATLFDAASFLTDLPLLYIQSARWDSIAEKATAAVRFLRGDHHVVPTQVIERGHIVDSQRLYVQDSNGGLHLMRPYLEAQECPTCHNFETFHLDRVEGGDVIIRSMEHGHPTAAGAELVAAFNKAGYLQT